MAKNLRTSTFKTPYSGAGTNDDNPEVLATRSYVDNKILDLKSNLLNLIQTIVTDGGENTPTSNTIYIVNENLKITKPNAPSGVESSWSPKGIRVTIIATDSIRLSFNNDGTGYEMVSGQYYEFIYNSNTKYSSSSKFDESSWLMVNSWYARWE